MFGQIRRYKRIPEAIEAFAAVEDRRLRLVVAGGVADPALEAAVRERAAHDRRVVLKLEPVEEGAVADLHSACDAAFLHYRDVFSSGALMLALTLGLGVVAPRNTTADEVAGPPAVESYDGDDASGALRRMADGCAERRREAALEAAEAHPWAAMAETLQPLFAGR
jgi:glycosyltransferase involved in cell wall biosynthesis